MVSFESFFRGCFVVFMRKIADYLTSENGKTNREKTQKYPDNIFYRKILSGSYIIIIIPVDHFLYTFFNIDFMMPS